MSDAQDPGRLLVADSFRVRVGPGSGVAEVRGWDLHVDRFARSVAAADANGRTPTDGPAAELPEFLAAAAKRIAAAGEGFPRMELWGATGHDRELRLSLRPLPPIGTAVELRTARGVSLAEPGVKGPNIARLARLNRELSAEALLLDEAGDVLEGATTSLVWWDRYTLCAVGRRTQRVASVTEQLVLEFAGASGAPPRPGTAIAPAELSRHEVWAVNALHGIRPVTSIDGVALPAPDERRLLLFREALDRCWQPVARPALRGG